MSIASSGVEGSDRVPSGNTSFGDPPEQGTDGLADRPWLDPDVLLDMEDQLGGPAIPLAFARDYARLWDQRQRALVVAIEDEDRDAALDAVISVKVSSAMVGGARMSRLAESLETCIRNGDFPAGRALLDTFAGYGAATVDELRTRYITKAI